MINELGKINRRFEPKSTLKNDGSLSFAISHAARTEDWAKQLAYLLRALLVDHVFDDGNKRTAVYLILNYFKEYKIIIDEDKINRLMIKIASKNITKIDEIRRLIKNETI